jgi:hypothetical protein
MDLSTLQTLGISKEDILDKVVKRIMEGYYESGLRNDIVRVCSQELSKIAHAKVNEFFEELFEIEVRQFLSNYLIPQTNNHGEAKGESYTLTEFLLLRLENLLHEDVDVKGRPRGQRDYDWKRHSSRLVYLVDQKLYSELQALLQEHCTTINAAVKEQLAASCLEVLERVTAAPKK